MGILSVVSLNQKNKLVQKQLIIWNGKSCPSPSQTKWSSETPGVFKSWPRGSKSVGGGCR